MVEPKHVLIAPVGGAPEAIFSAVREFPLRLVVLITEKENQKVAEKAQRDLERFTVPSRIETVKGPLWEEVFRIVHEVVQQKPADGEILINVTSGKDFMRCAVTSAAFVNGLKAFGVSDKGEIVLFPVLRFSYYNLLSDRKMQLLTILSERDGAALLDDLSRRAKMSLSLASYHVNGNLKSDGLKQLGLVETHEKGGRVHVTLTTMGRLLLKGYV